MCQSTSDKSAQPGSCYISLQAVILHPQPRYLSPANISQQSPCFPQQQYPDLELGQIVHRRKPTPFKSPVERLFTFPRQDLHTRFPTECLLSSPQQGLRTRSSAAHSSTSAIYSSV